MIKLGDIFVYLKGDDRGLSKTLDAAEQKSRSVAGNIGNFFSVAFGNLASNIVTGALNRVVEAIGSIKDAMIGGNTAFEQYQTQFQVLLGNADLAQQRMQELAEFGQRTPFELPEVVQADRILQGFGLHAAGATEHFRQMGIDIREITGDVAAGTGASFQEVATLIGRFSAGATGEAIQRFQELGITTRAELAGMGVEFSKSGELLSPLPEAMDVVLQLMQQKFGGLMDAQSQTFGGMLSNLADWANNAARTLGAPIFDRLKEGLQSFLELVEPGSPVDNAINEFADTIRLAVDVVATLLGILTGGGIGSAIEGWATAITEKLQQVNAFLRQLKDEILGLTAGDILGELGPGLDSLNQQMNKSLEDLASRHDQTISALQSQLTNAAEKLGSDLDAINDKYAKQIRDLNRRIADTAENFQERLSDMAEQHGKRRKALEDQIAKSAADQEERLTELKRDHIRRRQQLATNLMLAESEEQYLAIKAQMAAEDEKYGEQVNKTKKSNDEQLAELKARLDEEDAEYAKQEARTKKQRDKTLADLREQLAEVEAEKAKEVAEVQKAYDQQVAALNDKIAAENAAYARQQDEIRAMYAQRMADFQAEIEARAAAIGQGPAAAVAEWIRFFIDGFERLINIISDFIANQITPLKGALLGIGAVLLAGGVVAALSALAGLLSGISLPILAIVGAIALLYTAWTENWFNIQGLTQQAIDFLQPYWERLKSIFAEFSESILPKLQEVWQTLTTQWNETVAPALEGLWTSFQRLLDAFGISIDKAAGLEGVLWLVETALNAVKLVVDLLNPLIETYAGNLALALEVAADFVDMLARLPEAWNSLAGVVDNLVKKIGDLAGAMADIGPNLPDWLRSNSPTPLELGIRGITSALGQLPDLGEKFRPQVQPGSLGPALAGLGGPTTIAPTFNLGQAPADFDAAGLLGKIDQRMLKLLSDFYGNEEG